MRSVRTFAVAIAALFAIAGMPSAHAEWQDWQLGLIAGGFSKHYHVRPGEEERLNENQRTLGVEAIRSNGLIATASYYTDSFGGDSAYFGFGKLWTREFALGRLPELQLSAGGVGAITYRRMYAWWREHDVRPVSADEKRWIPFIAPVIRLSMGRVSLSTTIMPKLDFGGHMYTDFGIAYTQLSFALR